MITNPEMAVGGANESRIVRHEDDATLINRERISEGVDGLDIYVGRYGAK